MIGRLRGTYIDRGAGTLIIECGGVGYEVSASAHTLGELGPLGSEVTLLVFTHAQENKIALFGFSTAEERALFDLLVTVKRVGPSSAIKILSAGAEPGDLVRLIATQQVAQLTRIKGIGKKTAELLVVELRDKCEKLRLSWGDRCEPTTQATGSKATRHPILQEVTDALVQLGWKTAEADRAVAGLTMSPSETLESLLRQALRSMARF